MFNNTEYKEAIKRSFNEISTAKYMKNAIDGLALANSMHTLDFFYLAATSLKSDIMTRLFKVYEISRRKDQPRNIWYIKKQDSVRFQELIDEFSISNPKLEEISKKLKRIRDKAHFHIDYEFINNTQEVWKMAGLRPEEIDYLLISAFNILRALVEEVTGEKTELIDYDGSDGKKIILSYKKEYPDCEIWIGSDREKNVSS